MQDLLKQVDNILATWGEEGQETDFITQSDQQDVKRGLRQLRAALQAAAAPAPLADAELAELAEAQKGFPRVFVAEGLEIGTVAGWRIAKMNGNKSDDLFAQSITKVWNALPGLLARLAAAEAKATALQAFKDYVHGRLDTAGIYKHVEQNAVNGCRIGARLDDAFAPRTLTPREQQAIDNINTVLDGDGSDPDSGAGAWADCGEVDVPVLLDTIKRLTVKGGQPRA